jgi:hypothetical protein
MRIIKSFENFTHYESEGFFAPENFTIIEDPSEIKDLLNKCKSLIKPDIDKSPTHIGSKGELYKIITQNELDSLISYNMANPVLIYKSPTKISELEFPGRDKATTLAVWEISGVWIDNDMESFLDGRKGCKIKEKQPDIWFYHENKLNPDFPWYDEKLTLIN